MNAAASTGGEQKPVIITSCNFRVKEDHCLGVHLHGKCCRCAVVPLILVCPAKAAPLMAVTEQQNKKQGAAQPPIEENKKTRRHYFVLVVVVVQL